MTAFLASFACGLVFAIGLALGGMTQPSKVVGFLDFTGSWDPSLAFVMGGALAVHAVLGRFVRARPGPLFSPAFTLPTRTDVDRRLVAGAAIFGVGWGLGGFCPGPALVALGGGMSAAFVVVPAMIAGMLLHDRWFAPRANRPLEARSELAGGPGSLPAVAIGRVPGEESD
jgi:uncharacterized membrane protein YedE/YeeE